MKTPVVTIFVIFILAIGIGLAIYDYSKHGPRQGNSDISKSEAETLKETKLSGDEQAYKGSYEKAIEKYKHALKISPRDAYIHNDLGTAYYHLGLEKADPPMTEDQFDFGIEVDARRVEETETVLQMFENAEEKTKSGIITIVVDEPEIKDTVVNKALAEDYYAHAETETQENKKEYWITVIKGETKEAFLNAEKEYLEAIDIKSVRDAEGRKYSSYSTASRNLGVLYFRMGRKKDAVEQWRRAFQLEPTDAELRNLLGKYE
ncbi:tetratricopeptide repeat protein [Candidatus Poribacteria bacterium]|nr:tetratricopeptide repeat protein [Candidatus Poribacteria bacterium]